MPLLATSQMAKVLGVHETRLRYLGRTGVLTREENFLWDRDKTLAAYKQNVRPRKPLPTDPEKPVKRRPYRSKISPAVRGTLALKKKPVPLVVPEEDTAAGATAATTATDVDTVENDGGVPGFTAPTPTNGDGRHRPLPGTRVEADIRKLRAEAALKEMELRIKSGQYVEVAEMKRVLSGHVAMVRNSLLLFPAKLAHLLAAETSTPACHRILDEGVRELLTELSALEVPA